MVAGLERHRDAMNEIASRLAKELKGTTRAKVKSKNNMTTWDV